MSLLRDAMHTLSSTNLSIPVKEELASRTWLVAIPGEDAVAVPAASIADVEAFFRRTVRKPNDAEKRPRGPSAADDLDVVLDEAGRRIDKPARQFPDRGGNDQRREPTLDSGFRNGGFRIAGT